ncbi:hypothetical protein HOG48_00520 [Candidatus Peregrinibacteria bacterium]|jgi:hypothetical protein|nr:hypothetical protein [Candidatus Peregrinibacteria bacterium]
MGGIESGRVESGNEPVKGNEGAQNESFLDRFFVEAEQTQDNVASLLEGMSVFDEKCAKVEGSNISPNITLLLNLWILEYIGGPEDRDSYREYLGKRKEEGNAVTLKERLMIMADLFLEDRPELKAKVSENPDEEFLKLIDHMFELLFAWVPSQTGVFDEQYRENIGVLEKRFYEVWQRG